MITDDILETLYKLEDSAILNILFESYSASRRRMVGSTYMTKEEMKAYNARLDELSEMSERKKFTNLLCYLKRKGFIKKEENKWSITKKGIDKVLKAKCKLAPIKKKLTEEKEGLKVLIFDIPENEKHKRDWLRQSLMNLGFSLLQKSVWIGETKLPEDFFVRTKEMNILRYIHIFEVKERGSIGFNID